MLNFITGGVCAAQGFRAGGIHVGVKTHAAWKKDVALIVSDEDCACAAEGRSHARSDSSAGASFSRSASSIFRSR